MADEGPVKEKVTPKPAKAAHPLEPEVIDEAAQEPATRGPLGYAQDDSDGWNDLPAQMRQG